MADNGNKYTWKTYNFPDSEEWWYRIDADFNIDLMRGPTISKEDLVGINEYTKGDIKYYSSFWSRNPSTSVKSPKKVPTKSHPLAGHGPVSDDGKKVYLD